MRYANTLHSGGGSPAESIDAGVIVAVSDDDRAIAETPMALASKIPPGKSPMAMTPPLAGQRGFSASALDEKE